LSRLLLLNKPHGVICQFTSEGGHRTLKDFVPVPGVYPAGRLDTDSEGLVALTDVGAVQAMIADPRNKMEKGVLGAGGGKSRKTRRSPVSRRASS
jgi:23S rRNA pseudouridine2457 synthase